MTASRTDGPDIPSLRSAVEGLHGCQASFDRFERVVERHDGDAVWEGDIAVFSLAGHATADLCYAWSEPTPRSDNRRFFAVLRTPPISSAAEALRASILHDANGGADGEEE